MKKALIKDSLVEIRKSFGRFLSILLIVMLGVAFFAGLRAASPDMHNTADVYFDEYELMDIHLISTLGFSQSDLKSIEDNEYVEKAFPSYSSDMLLNNGDTDMVIKTMGMEEGQLNQLQVVEGRLPKEDDECVVLSAKASENNIKIGSVVKLKSGSETPTSDILKNDEFKVVGIVNSPYFISFSYGSSTIGSGSVDGVMFLPKSSYSYDVFTDIYIRIKGAYELNCFSEEYTSLIDKAVKSFEDIADIREVERYDEIIVDAQDEIDAAQKKLDKEKIKAQDELDEAKSQIEDGEKDLISAQKEIEANEKKLLQEKENGEKRLADAQAQITSGEAEYDKGLNEYTSNKQKFDEAWDELEQAKSQIKNYQTVLSNVKEKLESSNIALKSLYVKRQKNLEEIQELREELAAGGLTQQEIDEINSRISELEGQNKSLTESIQTLESGITHLKGEIDQYEKQISAAEAQIKENEALLESTKLQLEAAKIKLDEAKAQLEASKLQIEEGKKELNYQISSAQRQLSDAKAQVEEGKAEIEDAKIEYEKGKREADKKLTDAQAQIDEAKKELSEVEKPTWYVQDRVAACSGYSDYVDAADRMDAMAQVFPAIFLIVAALMCLNAMTRMVEEQRTFIGTIKGLGYSNASIVGKYIIYAAVASIVGSVIGVAFGIRTFPLVIYSAYGIMFNMPDLIIGFYPATAVSSALIAIVTTTLSAYVACQASLKSVPAKLMRPKSPKAGKRVLLERVTFIWKRLKFTHKVTMRNLFRYKKRFIMTVFGIGASVALILVGFGIRDSINNLLEFQFKDIYNYQLMITTNHADIDEVSQELLTMDGVEGVTDSYMKSVEVSVDEEKLSATVTAFEQGSDIEGFITLRNRKTKEPIELKDGEVVVTEKMATMLKVKPGDTITIHDGTDEMQVKIAAITEHYAMHYIYMTLNDYEQCFHERPESNVVFAHLSEGYDEESLGKQVLGLDNVVGVTFTQDITKSFNDMLSSLNYVVIVLIFSAAALTFLILYNLTNINVSERYREIATIKVLGFYDKEVLSYVYRENFLLTAIAIVLGCIGGTFLLQYIIKTVEVASVMFGRVTNPLSYLWSILLTVAFTLLVNLIMYFKLKKINMVEALKSVE